MSQKSMDADEFAKMLYYTAECIRYTHRVSSYNNCNNCRKKHCEYKPRVGENVRINCPLWEGIE